jgi:glyoxylase-like metal-dependent hydrolase (beta-lactamase superfamily II)
MELANRVHLVGSGVMGFDLSDAFDCHVYLIDGGGEAALVDVGSGFGVEAILAHAEAAGFARDRIRHVVLTHAHADHAGGAARIRSLLPGVTVYAGSPAAAWIRSGDEEAFSLAGAKRAGYYPESYVLEPCEVDVEVAQGDRVRVGDVELEVHETPGHADGQVGLLLDDGGVRSFFSADAIFHGGTIFLQATHDTRIDAQIRTLRHLRGLEIDGLFPGHLAFSRTNAQRHIERANEALDRIMLPNQLLNAW